MEKNKRKRRSPAPRVKDELKHSVDESKVDIHILARALKEAGGQRERLEIVSPTHIVVHPKRFTR